eukprot:2609426-Rhodomonas_salina.1
MTGGPGIIQGRTALRDHVPLMARGRPLRTVIKGFVPLAGFMPNELWEPPVAGERTKLNLNYHSSAHLCSSSPSEAAGEWGQGLTQSSCLKANTGLDILEVCFDSHRLPEPVVSRESERIPGRSCQRRYDSTVTYK